MRPSPICRRPPPPTAVISGHTQPIGVSPVRHVPPEFHPRRPPSPPRPRQPSREPLQTRKVHHQASQTNEATQRWPQSISRESSERPERPGPKPLLHMPEQPPAQQGNAQTRGRSRSPRGHQPTEPSLSASRSPPQTPAQPSQPPDTATPAKAATTPTTHTHTSAAPVAPLQISLHRHLRRRRPAQPSQTAATRPKPFARKNPQTGGAQTRRQTQHQSSKSRPDRRCLLRRHDQSHSPHSHLSRQLRHEHRHRSHQTGNRHQRHSP